MMRSSTIGASVFILVVALLVADQLSFMLTGNTVLVHLLVLGFNNPPVLNPIGSQTATEGTNFFLTVTANDADGDNLTFADNTSLFNIQKTNQTGQLATAVINFTPALSDVGNYTVNISVHDANATDFEIVTFSVVRGLFCGDSICSVSEDCSSCATDCGVCPTQGEGAAADAAGDSSDASGESAGTTGTGGSASSVGFVSFCEEEWICLEWNDCLPNGTQTRTCTDTNNCRTDFSRPDTQRNCVYEQAVIDQCSDGILNNGEEAVDCGGPCAPCVIQKFAQVIGPPFQFPAFARIFPWILILVTLTISAGMTTYDRYYMTRLKRFEFKEYRAHMARYVPLRRRIYTAVASLLSLSVIYSLYFYYFSLDAVAFKTFLWMPVILTLIIPVVAYNIIKQYEYSELRHKIAAQRLDRTHQRQLWQLERIEIDTMIRLEQSTLHELAKAIANIKELADIQSLTAQMLKMHEEHISQVFISPDIVKEVQALKFPPLFEKYPELRRIAEDIAHFKLIPPGDLPKLIELGGNVIDSVQEIARDNLLISVISSDPAAISIYNTLVEIHDYLEQLFKTRTSRKKNLLDTAGTFISTFDGLRNSPLVEQHSQDNQFVAAYNNLVDLYDHYQKAAPES